MVEEEPHDVRARQIKAARMHVSNATFDPIHERLRQTK